MSFEEFSNLLQLLPVKEEPVDVPNVASYQSVVTTSSTAPSTTVLAREKSRDEDGAGLEGRTTSYLQGWRTQELI